MAELKRERRKRTPIGTGNVLTAEQRPGFVRRYVNDHDGRVERFIEAGYTPVLDANADTSANKASKPSLMGDVVRKSVGGGRHAVLMEIPKEWYDEDQAEKQKEVDAREGSMEPNTREGQFGSVTIQR
jgi:hypothetical protein